MHLLSFNVIPLIETIGYLGLFAIIFAESGLFFGFFFPGDSLLFSAGLLAASGYLSVWILAPLMALAAILGDSAGYWVGVHAGRALFAKPDARIFKHRYLEETEKFYAQYGARAVLFARFIPIVRTFTPILAGAALMRYGAFLRYNILGGIIWGAGVPLIGYFLGTRVPNIEHYLLPIIVLVILVSLLPIAFEWWRQRRRAQA